MDQATADTVIIDCSAFEKVEGTWVTIRATEVIVGRDRGTAGRLKIDADVAIFRNYFRPAGLDLVELLDSRCITGTTP
jgi:hypothetical protein